MLEAKEPTIKLFGKTITVPEIAFDPSSSASSSSSTSPSPSPAVEECLHHQNRPSSSSSSSPEDDDELNRVDKELQVEKESLGANVIETQQLPLALEELTDPDRSSVVDENSTAAKEPPSRSEEDQSETCISQDKPLKKPDKILPCPRCNSMETKFCYYNNYNVNQPRHFCKNCQRYWTAGGSMRNVPVGAGRRKNKNSTPHYRDVTESEALLDAGNDITDGINHPSLETNATLLAFGSDHTPPLYEPMASVLNVREKTAHSCMQNEFHKPEELRILTSSGGGIQNGDDPVSGSVVTDSNTRDEAGKTGGLQEPVMQSCDGFTQMPCFSGTPWSFPCTVAPPAFHPAGFSMPFYPMATYWGCTVPGTWNIPWPAQSSSPRQTAPSCRPNTPALGKHSRDEDLLKPNNSAEEEPLKEKNSEKVFWIPKTSYIDGPGGEAAKSSCIWDTLGFKNDDVVSPGGRGIFKAFQSRGVGTSHIAVSSPTLQVNPAALSRSQTFHESS